MEIIFENYEVIIMYNELQEKLYVLDKDINEYFTYECDEYLNENENLQKGFLKELKNHSISNSTIRCFISEVL